MAEFIVNPRRAPRAPARCRAVVVARQGRFEADTEDLGSMGCQVVAPTLLPKGEPVQLVVTNADVREPLEVRGRVAWVSPQAPWRVGIAFDDGSLEASVRWFDRFVASHPGLREHGRVPDRIRTDATVYLAPPPRFLVDFSREEAALLRAIGSGARVDELMARLRGAWPAVLPALFSLIARQAITFQRGQSVHPGAWRSVLTQIEASLALESLDGEAPRPDDPFAALAGDRRALERPAATPAPLASSFPTPATGTPWSPPHDGTRVVDLGEGAPPLDVAAPASPRRSDRAQAAYERGLAQIEAGNLRDAISHLLDALALAPGDPEIAQQIGTLAFKGRHSRDG